MLGTVSCTIGTTQDQYLFQPKKMKKEVGGGRKNAVAIGNGQLHQMTMDSVSNTLDCMHDKQAVLEIIKNENIV